MKILMVASECVPFAKTGGLADVVGALPKALRQAGEDVRIVMPLYGEIPASFREQMEHVTYFYVNLGWRHQYCGIEKLVYEDLTVYFIDNRYYYDRDYIYGLGGDEGERFSFLCRAVLEMLPLIDFIPDVLHCHDWQTGMIPLLLRTQYSRLPLYEGIRTVYTIHNLQYQGVFQTSEIVSYLTLGDEAWRGDGAEFYGQCSFMKAGINYADRITTVSPTYSKEIQTAYYGERLDGLLREKADKLTGVLNGIDMAEYDPENDPMIDVPYTAESIERKRENKLLLQKRLGLTADESVPLIGMVGRLSDQKGLDLVARVLDDLLATGAQIVVLGKGDERYVSMLRWAQGKYDGQLAACIEMNHQLAHQIYAASDMFLMPSAFEPCGLSQMIALRYGSLPIVRETGGLRDTVLAYNEFTGEGNGFTFLHYNAHDMLHVVERAVQMYRDEPETWAMLVRRSMGGHYGWDESAKVYLALYEELTE